MTIEPDETPFTRTWPEHDWLLSVLIPVTGTELAQMERDQRKVFKKLELPGPHVRDSGVFCGRCQLAWEQMTPEERAACRGEVDDA